MTRPRTPPHWPRMKIRGARRRRLVALRRETRVVVPALEYVGPDADGTYTMTAKPEGTPGTLRAVMVQYRDGYGRPVRQVGRMDTGSIRATPRSVSFDVQMTHIDRSVLDLFFGKQTTA